MPTDYIDDFIFFARSKEEAETLRDRILADLDTFGFRLNLSKTCLTPAQAVTYLGFELHSNPVAAVRATPIRTLAVKE